MEKKRSVFRLISSIAGVISCIILVPILVMNLTIIVKSYINPDQVPDFLGIKPFIVITGSMEGTINGGDLVVTRNVDPATLEVGDIISYSIGQSVITHRITEQTQVEGMPAFITKGDANNTADDTPVTYDQIESSYLFRIPKIGSLAMFMQTPVGMLVFIGIPLCFFILYDVIRRGIQRRKEDKKDDEMQQELETLRAQLKEQTQNQIAITDEQMPAEKENNKNAAEQEQKLEKTDQDTTKETTNETEKETEKETMQETK